MSPDALSLLRTSRDAFRQMYGDYYLGALSIGGDTTTFLSTSSSMDLKSEMKHIQVKAKILWVSKTVYDKHTSTTSTDDRCDVTFHGFDTLSGYQKTVRATNQESYLEIQHEATQNVAWGMNLDDRAKVVLGKLGLGGDIRDTMELTEGQCKTVCESGLVVELVFLPYARLRDYILATSGSAYESL